MSGTTRVRGMAAWEPRGQSLELLAQVTEVLDEYRAYLPLTLRQIYYRLIAAHSHDKSKQAYTRLGELINRARRAGRISFDAIRDDDADLRLALGFGGPWAWCDVVRQHAEAFRLDRQHGQRKRLLVMVEAAGMLPQMRRIAEPYGIGVFASGGFDSTTAKHSMAKAFGDYDAVEVLHVGDYDPSGVHIFRAMQADVEAFVRDLGCRTDLEFARLAVTPEQISTMHLPKMPKNPNDRRSFGHSWTVQAEALAPDVLAQIVKDAIRQRIDGKAYEHVLRREKAFRADLVEQVARLQSRYRKPQAA